MSSLHKKLKKDMDKIINSLLIEEKIDAILGPKWKPIYFSHLEFWLWHGEPGFLAPKATLPKPVDVDIGRMVLEASVAECLTSRSEYIRELKKWFEEHTEKDYKILFECYDNKGMSYGKKSTKRVPKT
jgi:hypothetical protein